jgi:hypothetical protein
VAESAEYSVHGAAVLAVNQHFVVYAVKKGLIRVLHRHSVMKTLLRHHQGGVVSDIQFFKDGEVLATVSAAARPVVDDSGVDDPTANGKVMSKVVVWRVYEGTSEIKADPIKYASENSVHDFIFSVFWI